MSKTTKSPPTRDMQKVGALIASGAIFAEVEAVLGRSLTEEERVFARRVRAKAKVDRAVKKNEARSPGPKDLRNCAPGIGPLRGRLVKTVPAEPALKSVPSDG